MEKNTLIVNLFAGPGAGKSTFCAAIFAELKWMGIETEMALEAAKDLVWEGSHHLLKNQLFVFSEQQKRIFRLHGKLDVVVTDSPLLNSIIYDTTTNDAAFRQMILNEHHRYRNLNIFIRRQKPYVQNGRLHTLDQAKSLDEQILQLLKQNEIPYIEVEGHRVNTASIIDIILKHLQK